jgi:hypothetical protein
MSALVVFTIASVGPGVGTGLVMKPTSSRPFMTNAVMVAGRATLSEPSSTWLVGGAVTAMVVLLSYLLVGANVGVDGVNVM